MPILLPLVAAALLGQSDPLGTWEKLDVKGVARAFLLHVPARLPKGKRPLVLVFHGYGSNARQMATYSRFNAAADAHGFVVAYGEGVDKMWRVPGFGKTSQMKPEDDVAFAQAMIDRVSSKAPIDRKAVFSTGISNGGIFTIYLAQALNDKLAAIGPVCGTIYGIESKITLAKPVPAIVFHGTADKIVPYGGMKIGVNSLISSAEETVSVLTKQNHASMEATSTDLPDKDPNDGCTVKKITHPGPAEVVFYSITGGGHTWPGTPLPADYRKRLGAPCLDIDATELIWEFFNHHRRK